MGPSPWLTEDLRTPTANSHGFPTNTQILHGSPTWAPSHLAPTLSGLENPSLNPADFTKEANPGALTVV